jgi:hypothetical protein
VKAIALRGGHTVAPASLGREVNKQGAMRLSLPVLSADGKEALAVVSVESGGHGGFSTMLLLRKVGRAWRVESALQLAIS